MWTAVAHIVTGVIGSGVLSLAWSIAQLGWIGGPLTIVFFAAITLLSSFLLSNTYRSPDPELGPHRSSSYLDAVNLHKGKFLQFQFQQHQHDSYRVIFVLFVSTISMYMLSVLITSICA